MAKQLPYFRWYPKDCDTDELVRSMTDAEFGFYVRCLNHSWVNGSLPADLYRLARMMGKSKAQFNTLWKVVGQRFQVGDEPNRLINPRQEKERMHASGISKERTEAALERWKCNANAMHCQNAIASDLHKQNENFASLRAYESESRIEINKKTSLPPQCSPDFDLLQFRERVCKRWKKPGNRRYEYGLIERILFEGLNAEVLESAINSWADYWDKQGWNFCHQTLGAWLDGESWKTEVPTEIRKLTGGERAVLELQEEFNAQRKNRG
jgi:uncharacterized protein DUF1376